MNRLIDANVLIDGYKHMGYDPTEHPEESYMEGWCKGFNAAVDHCMHHVIHAPTIEPRKGKWERHHSGPYGYAFHLLYCSECGKDYYDELAERFNYCPNCGAQMTE